MSHSKISLKSKLPDVGTTIFTTMSQLAAETGAVNLGQGFPDFDCDEKLVELMTRAMRDGHNQYPPMIGIASLREAVAEKVINMYGRQYDVAQEVTITAGATQAIQTALTAVVRRGDEVIILEPVYDSYEPVIRLNGGTPIYARLRYPDFRPDIGEIASLITPRTRAILINTPHNPTATMWTKSELDALAHCLRHTDVIVISDEVYEHMVFEGVPHASAASVAGLAERAFVISSFGKTYHVTGWKIAYCLAPMYLMAEFRKAHQFVVFTVHTPSQHALAAYMQHRTHLTLPAFYQAKRDYFASQVKGTKFRWQSAKSTYFVLASFADIPRAPKKDTDFAMWLTREHGVACIPLSAFYHDKTDDQVVRFCFAKKEQTLSLAAERLSRL
jgi:methionine transaminase